MDSEPKNVNADAAADHVEGNNTGDSVNAGPSRLDAVDTDHLMKVKDKSYASESDLAVLIRSPNNGTGTIPRKRKTISDPKYAILPDDALLSEESAKLYLRNLSIRRKEIQETENKESMNVVFRMAVDDKDEEGILSSNESSTSCEGVAEVGLEQPPPFE
ncbi:hypothetical protein vseg_013259 [Gypsophila vaccaria]